MNHSYLAWSEMTAESFHALLEWAPGSNGMTRITLTLWSWQQDNIPHAHTLNPLRPTQNSRRFTDDTFKRIFLNENVIISIKISVTFVPKALINKYSSIGSDNGLEPNRPQAIIWTNDGLVYWGIYASLGLNEWQNGRMKSEILPTTWTLKPLCCGNITVAAELTSGVRSLANMGQT